MKKFTTWFVMCAVVLLAGCNRNSPKPVEKEVVLSVQAEGLKVILGDADAQRTFTVTAAENVEQDIAVKVSTDAAQGRVSLESETVTISKGSNTASGSIKFNTAAFPDGADEKIKLSIQSEGNTIEVGSVTFEVTKSNVPLVLPVATFHCDATEVFVMNEQLLVPVTIKLDKAAEQYTEFTILYDTDNTITTGAWMDLYPPYIDEGQKEVTFNMVFDNKVFTPGVTGVCHNKITSEYATIGDPSSVKFTVTGIEPNKATLSTDGLDIIVGDDDFEKTIMVTLAEEALADAVFNVDVESEEGGFEIVNKTITIAKGEKTGTGVIKFLKSAYPIELMTGTTIVSITTASPGVSVGDAGQIILNIQGTGTAPMGSVSIGSPVIKVGTADAEVSFTLLLSEPLEKAAVFNIDVTSDKEGCFTLNTPTVTINAGATTAFGIITFKHEFFKYDTDKANATLKISSTDVIVLNNESSTINFKVSGATVNPNKEDMKYKLVESYDVYVGSTGVTRQLVYVAPEEYGKKNTKDNSIDAYITGGKEGVDYEWDLELPTTITAGQGYTYLYVNILPAAAGKTLKVEITSDDATISSQNTTDLNVYFIEWPPVTRSAPKVKGATAWENYGLLFRRVKVAENAEYTFGFSRPDWVDYYDIQSFNVSEGANTIVMTLEIPTDSYYSSCSNVAVYADFNNDGNFTGAGEKIYLAKVEGLSVGTEKSVNITMNVPADAAAEFPVRIGTIVSQNIESDFEDGYFVLPGMENLIQMADFKFIKQ